MRFLISLLFLIFICGNYLLAQTDTSSTLISTNYIAKVASKANSLEQKLDKKSEKALAELQKQEAKMKKKLMKIDSLAANNVFANADNKYKELSQKLQSTKLKQYIPRLDSLSTSLKFLESNPQLLKNVREGKEKLQDALSKMKGLEGQLQKAEDIKKFLKERKQFLKEQLSKFGFAKDLKKINKQIYYYAQQVNEYKAILNDPKKIEKKALELLSKTKLFKDFMRKNSMLASIFPMPGGGNDAATQTGFAGLQTRTQVLSFLQNQTAMNNSPEFASVMQRNIQSAQGVVDQFRNKLNGLGGGSELDMPDFKPNNQKTKSFKQRLEFGSNLQTQKSNYFFPSTTDIGLSLGYKLNDKSIIGIGTSFKVGLGKDIEHIRISGEGFSLRSFMDFKIKKSFYASGGFEYNYQQSFSQVRNLYNPSIWKRSALLGVAKTISFKGKLIKMTKLQLLYDFLHREQLPKTEAFKFRIGYVF